MIQEERKEIKLVGVYARVSTARQEEEGTIETQLSAVREFAKSNNYSIVKEYIDDGWSGDILARPQLDQLREDAKQKIWEGVLAYDPDRIARRYSYQELVMDELREAGAEVLFVTTPAPKSGEEKILHGVKGLFAEYERVKIAERFRLGKIRKVKEGHILTSGAPYGYTYVPKKDDVHGFYQINEVEARIVQMIFHWIAIDRLTIRGVVRELQKLGIAPRKSKRGVWSTSTLTTLLRNKTYIGEAHYGKSYAVVPVKPLKIEKYRKMKKTSRKLHSEEKWIKIQVPAIIDVSLFEQAQKQLRENFALSNRNRKNEYLLSGKIWCTCNNRRAGEGAQRGKHLYYRCTARVHTFPLPAICEERGINARIADSLVWERISKLMSSPELLEKQLKRWRKDQKNKTNTVVVDIENIQKQISKLQSEEDRYAKAYGAGTFTIEQFKEYAAPLRDKVIALQNQIATIQIGGSQINDAEEATFEEINTFASKARMTLKSLNFEAKRSIVVSIVDKVVGTQKELQICGYIPLVTSNNYVGQQTIHRHCRSSKRRQIYSF